MVLPTITKIEPRGQNREIVIVFEEPYDLEELTAHCCDYLQTIYGDQFHSKKYEGRATLLDGFSEVHVFENGLDRKIPLFEGDPGTYVDGVGYDLQANTDLTMCQGLLPWYIRSNKLNCLNDYTESPLPDWCDLRDFHGFEEDSIRFILSLPNGTGVLKSYCHQRRTN